MAKFAHCHYADGLMWCQHFNGSWAPPFPATQQESSKSEEVEKVETTTSNEEDNGLRL
jgi:hypothetical protein